MRSIRVHHYFLQAFKAFEGESGRDESLIQFGHGRQIVEKMKETTPCTNIIHHYMLIKKVVIHSIAYLT